MERLQRHSLHHNLRRNLGRLQPWLLAIALVTFGLIAVPGNAIDGVGPLDVPNPNTNSLQTYCTTNYPGTLAVVISTGGVSNGAINTTVNDGFYLKWRETFTAVAGTINNVEAEILELRVGSAAGTVLQYVAAFSFVGGNDTYRFDIGTPVSSNTVGGVFPADSLKMANFNGNNFTHWGFCAYATLVPVAVSKTVAQGGSGNFVFTVSCTVISKGAAVTWAGYPLEVTVAVVGGGPVTVVSPVSVPVGANCTATEKAGAGDEALYTHEGPQSKATTVTGATFTFTNILRAGKLSFRKTLVGAVVGEPYNFSFSVTCNNPAFNTTFSLPSAAVGVDPLLWISGDVPSGVTCVVTETAATPAGAWAVTGSPTVATAVVAGVTTVTAGVTNTRKLGYFVIAKTTSDGVVAPFTFDVVCGGALVGDDVIVNSGGSSSVLGPYPTGTECTITENPPPSDLYTTGSAQTFIVTESTLALPTIKTFVNTRKTGKLSFTKTISGAVQGEVYSFSFALTCSNSTFNTTFTLPEADADPLTWTSGNIPTFVTCSVSETGSTPTGAWNATGSPTAAVAVVFNTTTSLASITNTHTVGYFVVAKTTNDGVVAPFTFDVTCGGLPVTDILLVNSGSSSGAFGPFSTGTSCTISERPDNPDVYDEGAPQTFMITESSAAAPVVKSFVNTRKTGKLSFTKTISGAVRGEVYSFTFALTCSNATFNTTFTLPEADADPLVWVSGDIPTGVSCTVAETASTPVGAWLILGSPTDSVKVVTNATTALGGITNERHYGSLTITKLVSDGGTGPFTVDYVCKLGTLIVAQGDDVAVSSSVPIVVEGLATQSVCEVTENSAAGYTTTYSVNGGVAVNAPPTGVVITSTRNVVAITNTAIPPKLTLVKVVAKPATSANPATASSWTLSASPSPVVAGTPTVLSETGNVGLTGTWVASDWTCSGTGLTSQSGSNGSTVVLARAAAVSCTITNSLVELRIVKDIAIRVGATCGDDEVWLDSLSLVVASTPLCYRFTITNTGSTLLENVSISDPFLGLVAVPCGATSLAPGASTSCVQSHTASFTAGSVRTNTATANGCASIGTKPCVSHTDTATYVATYQGFTPGFWKNHTATNSNNGWRAVYIRRCIPPLTETSVGAADYWNSPLTAVFPGIGTVVVAKPGDKKTWVTIANYNGTGRPMTMLQSLGLQGGSGDAGANEILLRAATAAWLNACFNETDPTLLIGSTWPQSSATISANTVSALTTKTRADRIVLASLYDLWNNTGTHFIDWSR